MKTYTHKQLESIQLTHFHLSCAVCLCLRQISLYIKAKPIEIPPEYEH